MKTDEEHFATVASPIAWYEVAKLLHDNARTLYHGPSGYITYDSHIEGISRTRTIANRSVFLLAGFAAENMIKSFLIYENPSFISNGKLSKELKSHKLSRLQQMCKKVPAPKRSLHVFETLEDGINSWARYPTGTSMYSNTIERSVTPEFWDAYNKVFDLYSKRLETLLSKKWKDPYNRYSYVEFT